MSADPRRRSSAGAEQLSPTGAGRLDTAIEWASGTTAVGMFAYGYALSYSVLYGIAVAVGLPGWAAKVWPLGFESFMASAALNALAEQRHRRHLPTWHQRVPWYPWTLTGLTAGASILLNWFHPAIPLDPPPGWLRSLVYGLPPLAAVFAWHLFLQRVAHRHHRPVALDTCLSASGGLVDTTVARLDTPPVPDTLGQAVDAQGVRALSAPDTPPVHSPSPDTQPATSGLDTQPAASGQAGSPAEPATRLLAQPTASDQAGSPAEPATAPPVDTPATTDTERPGVDAPAEVEPDPSTVDPAADAPGVQAPAGRVDAEGVQPSEAVSAPGRERVRDRLAAVHAAGRPDGAGWTARTLAAAASCGRSTAAAFLRDQRHASAQEQEGGGS